MANEKIVMENVQALEELNENEKNVLDFIRQK